MNRTELEHGGCIRLADENERTDLNAVIFEVAVFRKTGKYQDTIYFLLEETERTELSFIRRIDKENARYFQIYEDFIAFLESRTFYKDCFLTVNSTEYYPKLLFPIKE